MSEINIRYGIAGAIVIVSVVMIAFVGLGAADGETDGPYFEVSDLSAPDGVTEGHEFSASAIVTNTGDEAGTQHITIVLLDEHGEVVSNFDEHGSHQAREPGESAKVGFTVRADVEPGEYTLAIRSEDDAASQPLTVTEDPFTEADGSGFGVLGAAIALTGSVLLARRYRS